MFHWRFHYLEKVLLFKLLSTWSLGLAQQAVSHKFLVACSARGHSFLEQIASDTFLNKGSPRIFLVSLRKKQQDLEYGGNRRLGQVMRTF